MLDQIEILKNAINDAYFKSCIITDWDCVDSNEEICGMLDDAKLYAKLGEYNESIKSFDDVLNIINQDNKAQNINLLTMYPLINEYLMSMKQEMEVLI